MSKIKVSLVAGAIGLVLLLMGLIIANPFVMVGPGERGVVLVWGKVQDQIFDEGLHIVTPIATVVRIVDVKTQKEEVDASAASKDLQTVSARVALNYHLDPLKVNVLWQEIGKDYNARVIDPSVQEAIKAVTAIYSAEELITKRTEVREHIKTALKERLEKHHILVDEFSIVNFEFSASFNQAIEAKVTAEQQALTYKNRLEKIKFEA